MTLFVDTTRRIKNLSGIGATPPTSKDESRLFRTPQRGLLIVITTIAVVMIVFVWLLVAYRIGVDRSRDAAALQINQSALVRDYAERLVRNIKYDDRLLTLMTTDYTMSGNKLNFQMYASIFSDIYDQLIVLDAHGNVSNFASVRNQIAPTFSAFHDLAPKLSDGKLYIGPPQRAAGTQQWTLLLARALKGGDDSYQGAVLLRIDLEQFAAFNIRPGMVDPTLRTAAQLGAPGVDRQEPAHPPQMDHMMLYSLDSTGNVIKNTAPDVKGSAEDEPDDDSTLWTSKRLDPYPLLLSIKLATQVPPSWNEQGKMAMYLLYAAVPTALILLVLVLVGHVLSKQYLLMREYNEMRISANDISRRKSHYVATIVHELRSPLNGIHGFAELIKDESHDQESREHADFIHRSAQHLHGLVNTLFDVSKVESGRVVIVREQIESRPFFAHLGSMHEIVAHKKRLLFSAALADNLPQTFIGDRMKVTQIINNLLDNAIKFTSTGSISYDVRVVRGVILVTVQDSGIGMSEEDLKHLFKYYYQSESVRTKHGQGLGLGLSLAKDFAELMNGSIQVTSELNIGTKVEFRLPTDVNLSHQFGMDSTSSLSDAVDALQDE